jgi:DNA invertase Pin-like site-specific DNA recombinase
MHLFLGTHQENEDDKVRKGRQARGERLSHPRAKGEANGNAKLTIQAVQEIRAATLPQRAVAKAYGVTQALVSKIQRGEIWK